MQKSILCITAILFLSNFCQAQEEIEFTGVPEIQISENGVSRTSVELSEDKVMEFKCTITRIDDKYYWTTRENVELVPTGSGAFTTFIALNGSGYVRIIKPGFKKFVSPLSETGPDFDYVEHMLLGLTTITYYGKSK